VEGTSVTLPIHAVDPDGDSLTFVVSGLPAGLTMSATGLISGVVKAGTAGHYDVRLRVSDGQASASTEFDITIQTPGPPKRGKP